MTNREGRRRREYNSLWQKFRAVYLSLHPICVKCESKGYVVPAVLIHHVKPLDEGGSKYNEDNLQALCNDCHEEIHGKDRFKRRV
jgi:5-methylcytosine-specific restriction protein A